MKIAKCPKCGKFYNMGINGVVGGCDICLGIQRDANGYAWNQDETEHTYQVVKTGGIYKITRDEAFNK
jgi:hypothetical protein